MPLISAKHEFTQNAAPVGVQAESSWRTVHRLRVVTWSLLSSEGFQPESRQQRRFHFNTENKKSRTTMDSVVIRPQTSGAGPRWTATPPSLRHRRQSRSRQSYCPSPPPFSSSSVSLYACASYSSSYAETKERWWRGIEMWLAETGSTFTTGAVLGSPSSLSVVCGLSLICASLCYVSLFFLSTLLVKTRGTFALIGK